MFTNQAADTVQTTTSLGHLPQGERWNFDDSVTRVFDDMLRRSIPQYDVMRSAVFDVGAEFVQPDSDIVDLGCARGEALAQFITTFGAANRYVGVEVSPPMLEAVRDRFASQIAHGVARCANLDLRTSYPKVNASVTLCLLTLQFTPIEYRQRILQDIYRSTLPGGVLILVEKVLGATPELERIMIRHYHKLKTEHGTALRKSNASVWLSMEFSCRSRPGGTRKCSARPDFVTGTVSGGG